MLVNCQLQEIDYLAGESFRTTHGTSLHHHHHFRISAFYLLARVSCEKEDN